MVPRGIPAFETSAFEGGWGHLKNAFIEAGVVCEQLMSVFHWLLFNWLNYKQK